MREQQAAGAVFVDHIFHAKRRDPPGFSMLQISGVEGVQKTAGMLGHRLRTRERRIDQRLRLALQRGQLVTVQQIANHQQASGSKSSALRRSQAGLHASIDLGYGDANGCSGGGHGGFLSWDVSRDETRDE